MRVVVLGAGFGGLELTTKLSEEFGDTADVVLIDREDGFIFGFSKLDVMFGRATEDAVLHRYSDIARPGVQVVKAEITAIDPVAKHVDTTEGAFDADILVIAWAPMWTPGRRPAFSTAVTSSTRRARRSRCARSSRTSRAAESSS